MIHKISFLFIGFLFITSLTAANGDKIIVTTHNGVIIKTNPAVGVTEYSGWGAFPKDKNIHRVYADLQFECAPGLKCGEWDYLNHIYLRKRKGKFNDSLGWELMRFVTPYGFYWDASQNWKHSWRYDITDFANLLQDSCEIIYQHSGYEGNTDRGWKINLTFTFEEGIPEAPVLKIDRLHWIHAPYGNDSLYDARVDEKTFTYEPNTKRARIKIIQSGHGMDKPDNCAEFCPKKRYLVYDNNIIDERYVWRDDCGENSLYPQAGTWIYDRTNWCPGSSVKEFNKDIDVTGDTKHTLDIDMENYTTTSGGAVWVISSYLIQYGEKNLTLDAGIYEIVAPNNYPEYKRENPICGKPKILIKNNGKQKIENITLEYGLKNRIKRTDWKPVNIMPGEVAMVIPEAVLDWSGADRIFEISIKKVNEKTDDYSANDYAESNIPNNPPVLPSKIIVYHKTNNAASENSFVILDGGNNVFYKRKNYAANATMYRDTIQLYTGCFQFIFYDTGAPPANNPLNEDGINWWANTADGTGVLQIRNMQGQALVNFNGDFGTSLRYNFTTEFALKNKTHIVNHSLKVFPIPTENNLVIDIPENCVNKNYSISIMDITGKIIEQKNYLPYGSFAINYDVSKLKVGTYLCKIMCGNFSETVKWIKQ